MLRLIQGEVLGLSSAAFFVFSVATSAIICASAANAVSLRVKLACSRDYFALCSQFASDSPETRACMRAAGEKLSTRCINALVDAGEVSPTEVSRRAAQLRQ